jgi:CMP-N,N'-diacetyllegionaminic acid synthase
MNRSQENDSPRSEVLALIPARSGSKSVPGKNLRQLLGKPLIAYSIEHALHCRLIDRVIVTTDSPEIADVARAHGAEAPFLRPAEISADDSRDVEFHHHALQWLEAHEGYRPRLVVNLRPTHPIRRPETIARAIEIFAATDEADSLRSVRPAVESPFKMWRIDAQGFAAPVATLEGVSEPYNMPRQALPLVFWQDCYVDITRPDVIFEQGSTSGQRILPFVIDEECVDIDYEDELEAAERLLVRLSAKDPAQRPPGPRCPR